MMMRISRLILAAALGLTAAVAQAQAPAAAAAVAEYKLGTGDVVRVVVYQNPDLTLETRVSETGVISYPLLGNVRIGGLGVSAAEKLIADGLKERQLRQVAAGHADPDAGQGQPGQRAGPGQPPRPLSHRDGRHCA